jgi:NADPH:quinone reductase-like Zn-dependent oxidoreductase
MKRIQYERYGGPELMKLDEFELPVLGRGEVAVKVKFAAINPIDWKVRNGYLKMVTGKVFPRAMGSDFSGTVISVGAGVARVKQGYDIEGEKDSFFRSRQEIDERLIHPDWLF